MNAQTDFTMSQGLVVLPPKNDHAFPIPCEEWAILKGKIGKLSAEPWFFHTLGSLLLGAALSILIAILLGSFSPSEQQRAYDLAWMAFAVTLVCGSVCLLFAQKERTIHRERATDVVAQMELIEMRFDRASG